MCVACDRRLNPCFVPILSFRLLQTDPDLFRLYKELVVAEMMTSDEFWASRTNVHALRCLKLHALCCLRLHALCCLQCSFIVM